MQLQGLLPLEGACRCGDVGIRVDVAPVLTVACHCTGCQRMSASAFSLSAIIPAAGFAVTRGEPVIGGLHREDVRHYFCPYCMTWMFTRLNEAFPFVNVRPTMFNDCSWFTPFIETYTSEKLPWATTPAVHSFEKLAPPELYARLGRAYAQYVGGSQENT